MRRFVVSFAAATLLSLTSFLGACGGGGGGTAVAPPVSDPDVDPAVPRTRYSFNNKCYVLKSNLNGKYIAATADGYAANGSTVADATAFYLKPASLGSYLLYTRPDPETNGQLLNATSSPAPVAPLANVGLDDAADTAIWTVTVFGDLASIYPPALQYDVEPTPEQIATYRNFIDPNAKSTAFRFTNAGQVMTVAQPSGVLSRAAIADPSVAALPESFSLQKVLACASFPEAEDNTIGETFKGTTADGRVLGMADVHVHVSSTTFLGGGLWGTPFHKFGVTHALPACSREDNNPETGQNGHGEGGSRDIIGAFLGGDFDGHGTAGWPSFADWPSRHSLTHQAIYWKWLERGWKSGLRVMVNDLVDNGTLCELERNNSSQPDRDCNEMNSAGRQAGTMYAMQDYIDAQYGGRGAGFFQIVWDADQARAKIVDGKLAVVLGIEISNFLNCQVTYNPNPTRKEPFEEPEAGDPSTENTYTCTKDSLVAEMDRIWNWGVRQVISIHEFDNAFGGNGVFFPIINVGNRENSGGLPSGASSEAFDISQTPTGEYWTTYDCPIEGTTAGFSGYLWEDAGGASGAALRSGTPLCQDDFGCAPPPPGPPLCAPAGQGGRYGGSTLCYPDTQQCNARWMTPIGLFMYGKLMEKGFIFDFDHMELHTKSQALDLTEAQPIAYPIVSTHGTYGGTSMNQARRVLKNGGFLYPSVGGSTGFLKDMQETRAVYESIKAELPAAERLFGFGFGTDTNGLSDQAGTEDIAVPGSETGYPFALFRGGRFEAIADFVALNSPVSFAQPASHDLDGKEAHLWSIGADGSAHYGMLSDFVEAVNLQGSPQDMADLFNSAERYLRTWKRTQDASAKIKEAGGIKLPAVSPLIAAPVPDGTYPPGD
jgi:hypothetical protein